MKDITLVIPAKSESDSLPKVLNELKKFPVKKIIVIPKNDILTFKSARKYNCKIIFQKLKKRKISIGVFIKAILKINNIAAEFEKLFQYNLPMLGKLREIPRMTLKFVVTNQSLYI